MTFSVRLVTQSFTTESASSLPSGEETSGLTELGWPLSGSPHGVPVAASQNLIVSSSEPDVTE